MSGWYACEQPERQPDAQVRWHYEGCEACRVKAETQALRYPDDMHCTWLAAQVRG